MDNLTKIDLNNQDAQIPIKTATIDTKTQIGAVEIPKLGNSLGADIDPKKRENDDSNPPKTRKRKFKLPKWSKKVLYGLSIVVIALVGFGLVVVVQLISTYRDAMKIKPLIESLQVSMSEQNIGEVKGRVGDIRLAVEDLQGSYARVAWMRALPLVGKYVEDATHGLVALDHGLVASLIAINTVEPYADILGFSGNQIQSASGDETAQERLDFVVQTLPDLIPKIDELSSEMEIVKREISYIDPNDYPQTFRGIDVRDSMERGLRLLDSAAEIVTTGRPLLQEAPYLLGTDETRTYLILFQNDKELRPTGGFLTAYSIATVNNARFEPVYSDDIYNIDARYTPVIRAPEPIVRHIKGPYILNKNLRLRDMNWSPDFAVSMEQFVEEAKKVGIDDIDGVIAVDTQLLVNILDALGPIDVPGFGTYSTEIIPECNCPQVVYELESFADNEGPVIWDPLTGEILQAPPNIDNRKKIIGPLMNSVLSNALGSSKEKIPALFEAGFQSIIDKNILMYVLDEEVQEAVESFGVAGRIEDTQGDYLHINDANLGGRKSNLYVTSEVSQNIEIAGDGTITKTLDIAYKNPQRHDGWLNSVLPNYVRIYVPEGSVLVDSSGFEEKEEPYEELGKTVFAGFFQLRPQGVSKITLTYKLPFALTSDDYPILIQKQPGANMPLYKVNIGKSEDEFFLNSDKDLHYDL